MTRRSIAATALGPFLLLVAALAAPATQAGGGCHGNDGSAYTEGDGNTVIRMDVCSFSPTINRVPIGATVRFLNTSNVEHAVAGRAGTWGSAILPVAAAALAGLGVGAIVGVFGAGLIATRRRRSAD